MCIDNPFGGWKLSENKNVNILSVSGGKDSTAMILWALEQGIDFKPVFADTGNEHDITLDYVRSLPGITGCPPIQWVKADFSDDFAGRIKRLPKVWGSRGLSLDAINSIIAHLKPTGIPFVDICQLKGRFPSFGMQFCTEYLKIKPIHEFIILPLLEAGHTTTTYIGVRSEESRARSKLPEFEDLGDGRFLSRPLLSWSVSEVFAIHKRHNVEPNPLYKLGSERVGCMPCFMERKGSLRNLSKRFPEHINKIALWEEKIKKVSKDGDSTFFARDKTPGIHQKDASLPTPTIHKVVDWSNTKLGGVVHDPCSNEELLACVSRYGLCE